MASMSKLAIIYIISVVTSDKILIYDPAFLVDNQQGVVGLGWLQGSIKKKT